MLQKSQTTTVWMVLKALSKSWDFNILQLISTSTGEFTRILSINQTMVAEHQGKFKGPPNNGTPPTYSHPSMGKPIGRGGPIIGGFPRKIPVLNMTAKCWRQATTPHKRERHLQTSSRDASNDVPVAGCFCWVSAGGVIHLVVKTPPTRQQNSRIKRKW